jgi:hypothetical protein
LLTLHERLHLAPLDENVQNVLDIATGTGIWAIDFGAYTFLPATYGIRQSSSGEIHLIQCYWHGLKSHPTEIVRSPKTSLPLLLISPNNRAPSVPPNCRFEVDDVEDDWTYSHSFDYIHGRMLITALGTEFHSVVSKAYAALNSGGWFELQDMLPPTCFDNSWDGTELKRWVELTLESATALG